MADDPSDPKDATPGEEHVERVKRAFDSLHENLGDRAEHAKEPMDALRSATAEGDADRVRAHLTDMRESHGWLYEELAKHPDIASLVNELALWGF
jgi:hypothetical protein